MNLRILLLCLFVFSSMEAAYVFKNGRLIDSKDIATLPVEDHYNLGVQALNKKDWDEAVHQFRVVTINFPQTSWGKESFYFLGVAYFHADDKDMANQNFSSYLEENGHPTYFEETFQYKLAIADAFKKGAKRHLLGYEKLPAWMPDTDLALTIYDEVINSLPHNELAAKALLAKGDLLRTREEFRASIDAYNQVIRKFPRSESAAQAYSLISRVYLQQAEIDVHNPDIIPLAQINIKRFAQDFPRDEKIQKAEDNLHEMKEIFANALYETGQFYERKKQPKASVLYYHTAINQFPDTKIASSCKERLDALQPYVEEIQLK
ncbi:MAG: outer membrane protein assembly factor BamD [Verrucomicrobia bacterium]|nr:outer membrane protein assembly factor BamD [Verrucomicrobiota bacterium]MBS0637350.1 outer membrane protein assembly factor BamD [Verrucomicrobiota bacterium]